MKNSYSWPQARWKSGLFGLSRPFFMCFVIRSKFGPCRPKISQICGGTPTFYWPPRLYLPIGIQNCPCFCWWISSHFWLGSKSQQRPVCDGKSQKVCSKLRTQDCNKMGLRLLSSLMRKITIFQTCTVFKSRRRYMTPRKCT